MININDTHVFNVSVHNLVIVEINSKHAEHMYGSVSRYFHSV